LTLQYVVGTAASEPESFVGVGPESFVTSAPESIGGSPPSGDPEPASEVVEASGGGEPVSGWTSFVSSTPPSPSSPGLSHSPLSQSVSEKKHWPLRHVEKASQGTLAQSGSIEIGMRSRVCSTKLNRRRATMQPSYLGGLQLVGSLPL
jgi:hypothetical protein